ncbi:MAG: HAD family hydrolase [Lachnospiraceae bacterium]|nr:HAD family hydrolase [Lachnospiraceae bacterium]
MIKAYFLDYTGTMVKEDEPYTRQLLEYFVTHSNINDPKEILRIVWDMVKTLEAQSHGDAFIRNDEKVDRILDYCVREYGLNGDLDYMHQIWRNVWVRAPLFEDVKEFFERSKLPIYVLSNDDLSYLEESMKIKGLEPAGIISAEMARACKPNKAIFEKAMEIAKVKPNEVIHIGDSITSDIEPAKLLGITPVYISRKQDVKIESVRVIRSLRELL